MMEERDWLQTEARKLVIGEPTINEDLIDAAFSLICPEWDYNMAEGKASWSIARLCWWVSSSCKMTCNLSKVYDIRQEADESPAVFLESVQETFRRYTPYDLES